MRPRHAIRTSCQNTGVYETCGQHRLELMCKNLHSWSRLGNESNILHWMCIALAAPDGPTRGPADDGKRNGVYGIAGRCVEKVKDEIEERGEFEGGVVPDRTGSEAGGYTLDLNPSE